MKKALTLLILSFSFVQGFSQKPEINEKSWMINHILYLSETTGAGSVVYVGKKSGLVFVDQKIQVEKEIPVSGNIIGIAKWKGNIVCITTDSWDRSPVKEIHAILIDVKTRTITSDKLLYQNPGENQLECWLERDPLGNFNNVLVRISALEGVTRLNMSQKKHDELNTTTQLTAFYLTDAFEPRVVQLAGLVQEGRFLNHFINKKGEIIILSTMDKLLIAEKFGTDGQMQKRLKSRAISADDNNSDYYRIYSKGSLNQASDDQLAISLRYEGSKIKNAFLSLFVFDFANEKVISAGETALNKDYSKQFKENPELKKAKNFKRPESQKPDTVFFAGDKLITCNENWYIYYLDNRDRVERYSHEGAIITVYNKQLQAEKNLYLDKYYQTAVDIGRGFSYHIRNGNLYILGNEVAGVMKLGNYCYVIDLDNLSMEKRTLERGDIPKMSPVNTKTVFWFKDNILLSHLGNLDILFYKKIKTYLSFESIR